MLLLINNSKPANSAHLSYITHLRKALRFHKIPFQETSKIDPKIDRMKFSGIILSGSPMKLTDPTFLSDYAYIMHYLMVFSDLPVFGICFGYQFLAYIHGLEVENQGKYHCESSDVYLSETHPLFHGFSKSKLHSLQFCFSDLVITTPAICKKYHIQEIGWFHHNNRKTACALDFGNRKYGTLFHPEYFDHSYSVLLHFYRSTVNI
jgi:GMP synthase-like glutamine amidotransferase